MTVFEMFVTTEYLKLLFNTTPMFVYGVLFGAFLLSTLCAIGVKGLKSGLKTSSVILLVIYATIVICTTVMFRSGGYEREIIIIPFWSYRAYMEGHPRILVENIMNVLAFIPIGILLAIAVNRPKWWKAAIVGCIFSVVIEFMQYYFDRGQCEIDDVIHNTLGCLIGYWIFSLFYKGYEKISKRRLAVM